VGRWIKKPTDHRRGATKPMTMGDFRWLAQERDLQVTEHISNGGKIFINVVEPNGSPRTVEIIQEPVAEES
jgi:hypothetical protein